MREEIDAGYLPSEVGRLVLGDCFFSFAAAFSDIEVQGAKTETIDPLSPPLRFRLFLLTP